MEPIAVTPEPPYYAVIFSSILKGEDRANSNTALRLDDLATQQEGFLGVESVRDKLGVTVSYWRDLESIKAWKVNLENSAAQAQSRQRWYKDYKVRISKVERDFSFSLNP